MPNPKARIVRFVDGKPQRLSGYAEDVIHSDGESAEEHMSDMTSAHGRRVATLAEVDEITIFGAITLAQTTHERKFDAFWETAESQKKREEI